MPRKSGQFTAQGIILGRTDYGEADKILTFLTPDHGKVKAIAKGVRKAGAKLAGAVELFSVADISAISGRGEIDTLTSARLVRHYGNIIKDLQRTSLAYELLRITDKATESQPESGYFGLLDSALASLDDRKVNPALTELWFKAQLLKLAGHTPNLRSDGTGKKLEPGQAYTFDYDKMLFQPKAGGGYHADEIKFIRLCFSQNQPKALQRINRAEVLVDACRPLTETILKTHIRL